MKKLLKPALGLFLAGMMACQPKVQESAEKEIPAKNDKARVDIYSPVQLTTDLAQLSEAEKKMIPLLIDAAKIMDALFWQQAYGNKQMLL